MRVHKCYPVPGIGFLLLGAILVGLLPGGARPATGQTISPEQVRRVQEDPRSMQQACARVKSAGVSADQVRAQLQAAGYAADLLDSCFRTTIEVEASPQRAQAALNALDILGVDTMIAAGIDTLPVDTGMKVLPAPPASADEVTLFGLDVFTRTTTQFQPVLSGPVPATYRLGPGDVLVLVISGDVEFVHTLEINRNGFVLIPQVGQVFVNNLTLAQLETALRNRLGSVYSGIGSGSTHFDVSVARLRTNQVYVIGEVAQPGAYQLASVATVLNALYAAGGPTERGNFRAVEVRRQGRTVDAFDLYDYLLRGDTRADVVLEQGDVVFVPVHGTRVTVTGAVVRPAIYELKPGETIEHLIAAAGGLRADAALERIAVSRVVPPAERRPNSPSRIVVNVALAGGRPETSFVMQPGDQVEVLEVPSAARAVVTLNGNVYHPGEFGWRPGMRLSDLVTLAGGFRPATYSGRAHIERLNPADSTRYLMEVPLPEDPDGAFPNDLALQEYDVVTVYGREEFRQSRTIRVAGMVNNPGEYPYREGMTLRDLILMARGLQDGAYLREAEVARLPADRSSGQLAQTFRVAMDSSYLFEPGTSSYRFLPGISATGERAAEVRLEPFDHVLVLKEPEFELQRMVKITGEVRFPGTYALSRKDERVSDLLQRAGGLLHTAYPDGAEFYRSADGAGRVNLSIEDILRRPTSGVNLALQPGDSLHVPEYNPVVRVMGAVNAPSSVLYRPGADLSYYIANAGGFTRDADTQGVSVRHANGSAEVKKRFLLFSSSPEPKPGSTVYVPILSSEDRLNMPQLLSNIVQITGSIVTLTVLLSRL